MAGNPHPVTSITGLSTTANVSKSAAIAYVKARTVVVMASVAEVRATDLTAQVQISLPSGVFTVNAADTTTVDDGVLCVRDANGLGFFRLAREKLNAPRGYYVRTDGNDTNSGLGNTAGTAFLTIQRALNVAASLDFGEHYVVINVADGTYTGAVVFPKITGGRPSSTVLYIVGNDAAPQNVIISTTSLNAVSITAASAGSICRIQGMELRTTASGTCISAYGVSHLQFHNIRFGASAYSHIDANFGALVQAVGNFYTVGSAPSFHYLANYKSVVELSSVTDTYSGALTFGYTAIASSGGLIRAEGGTQTVASGSVTATRHLAQINGIIVTGLGANFFPGNVAGFTQIGGQYY